MNILFVGDVVGKGGREAVRRLVPELRREYNLQFVIVNGENSAGGNGLTASCARELSASADVITSGDHTWDQRGFENDIGRLRNVIRPANYAPGTPGAGYGIFDNPAGGKVAVISLQGRVFMRETSHYSPFETVDEILKKLPESVKTIFVDFHAEATSEKLAMQYHLDGRVTAVIGTHTHVQTADARVSEKGTAMMTDAGMVGADISVLGRDVKDVLRKFTTSMPNRLAVVEKGVFNLCGAVVTCDMATGRASGIAAISRKVELE